MLNSVSDIPFLQKKKYNESAFITKRVTNKYNMSFYEYRTCDWTERLTTLKQYALVVFTKQRA